MKQLRFIIRLITGALFIFSGTVKAIDPMGSTYKFSDYFTAFGLDFLQPLSLTLTFILCLAEFISGFALLTGIRYRQGLLGVTILITIFTPLTFILAITNPVSDCGCFGDAIKLTNWQTFWKNFVLLAFVLLLVFDKQKPSEYIKSLKGWLAIGIISLFFVIFTAYNLIFLPVIDFLPFRTGNNIREQMTIPDEAPAPVIKTTFIYEKDGVKKEFTINNYPANDSSWVFVDQKSVIIKKGYEPPVHGFSIVTTDNRDITDIILDNPGNTLLMISPKLERADDVKLEKGFEIGRKCLTEGIRFYVITASGSGKVKEFDNGLAFCLADEITLKTMVRTNPGYILLRNGTVIGKWSWANLPEKSEKFKEIK